MPKLAKNKSEKLFTNSNFTQPICKKRTKKNIPNILEGKGISVKKTQNSPNRRQPKIIKQYLIITKLINLMQKYIFLEYKSTI